MRKSILAFAFLALCPLALMAQQTLNNDAVIKLAKAGLSEDLIITTINSQAGSYDTSTDGIIALKTAGVSDKVVSAIVLKASPATPSPATQSNPASSVASAAAASSPAQESGTQPTTPPLPAKEPRVFLTSASKGTNRNAARDQSMEMSKDIEKNCPGIRVTINQQVADYTILLNHIEMGLLVRDNQIQIANKDGDLISKTKEGGSINGGVKKACDLILADWAKK